MTNIANITWTFKLILFVLAIAWGLSENGADILNAPAFVHHLCGNYMTEMMALIIAWVSYDLYECRY